MQWRVAKSYPARGINKKIPTSAQMLDSFVASERQILLRLNVNEHVWMTLGGELYQGIPGV
jgi:hypothetical protein